METKEEASPSVNICRGNNRDNVTCADRRSTNHQGGGVSHRTISDDHPASQWLISSIITRSRVSMPHRSHVRFREEHLSPFGQFKIVGERGQ